MYPASHHEITCMVWGLCQQEDHPQMHPSALGFQNCGLNKPLSLMTHLLGDTAVWTTEHK